VPFNVSDRVSALIGEVGRIEKESEGVYLALGRLFPRLVAEMGKSSDIARNEIRAFSTILGEGSAAGLGSMASFAEESGVFFKKVQERDAAFLALIVESIERLSGLEEVIGRVRLDSEEMEIISLNAMTVALKSGNAGKAFSVITDELKRLSTRTIALTEEITARGRSLLEYFGKLRDSLGELEAFQSGFFAEIDRALSHGYHELDRGIRDAVGFFGGLLDEAAGVREPIQSIMQGIQLQDIIRQSLQHVSISLEEARRSAAEVDALLRDDAEGEGELARAEELAYVAAIADLSSSLIEDIVGQLDVGAEGFASHVERVKGIIAEVEGRRVSYVAVSSRATGGVTDTMAFAEGSSRYLSIKKSVIGASRRLAEQVKVLDESFRGLASLLSRFQNIVVASRIEVAKNRALAGVTTTVQGMIHLTDRIGDDVSGAMTTTKDFIKVASAAIVSYAGSGGGDQRQASSLEAEDEGGEADRLQATLRRVESDIDCLNGAKISVAKTLDGFSLYTPEFLALIAEARGELDLIRGLSSRLKEARGDLLALKASVDAELGPDAAAGAIKNERLRSVIERFTIFTHKKTAGEIGNFDVEEGTEAGEITLF